MTPETAATRTLRIQTVLYQSTLGQLWRLSNGLDAAAKHVIDSGLVERLDWALGDSSPSPVAGQPDVDDIASTCGSLNSITYEFFAANLGSSGGQNQLAEGHASDLLLVLNPDTYVSPTALTELVRVMDSDQNIGIVEPRQIPLEHPRFYDPITGDTSWASGFCMLIRRSLFDVVGGFDSTNFLLHCDDVDLSWRVRLAGFRVVVAPFATVFHDKRPEIDNPWPAPDHEVYHSALGRLMLARRWGRPDVVQQTVVGIESGTNEIQKAALAAFRERSAVGEIPDPEPDADKVAQFIDGEYARHRF